MKITLVNSEWLPVPPVLGGAVETTIYETALSIRDPELTVISPWDDQLENYDFELPDVFFHVDLNAEKEHMQKILGSRLDTVLQGVESPKQIYYLNGVTDLLEKLNPDVIQIHNRIQFASYIKKQFPQKRIIVYLHNHPHINKGVRDAVSCVDQLVFVSHFLARRFHRLIPSSKSKSVVIHNSVDTHIWHPSVKQAKRTQSICQEHNLKPGKTILFAGRTVYQKGISVLIDAVDHIRHTIPEVKLLIVGAPFFGAQKNSPFLTRLKKKAEHLAEHVCFTGFVPHDQTPYYYAAADVTAAPSIWHEPFGKVVIESMATGTPVIASHRGAFPEIIDDKKDGVLVQDPRDPMQLVEAILSLLNAPQSCEQLGQFAQKKVMDSFSKENRIVNTKQLYRTLT